MKFNFFISLVILVFSLSSCQSALKTKNFNSSNSQNPLKDKSRKKLISSSDEAALDELFNDSSTFCEVIERKPDCLDEEI